MSVKTFGFPTYTFLLALGQVLSTSSSQITVIMGSITQTERQLYTAGTIYAVTSIIWWILYRRLQSVYVLSLPFLFFGASYCWLGWTLMLGMNGHTTSEWSLRMVEKLYACGASSASVYFTMNFIEEESSPVSSWILRAGYISGLQYGYQALLWYWVHRIQQSINLGGDPTAAASSSFTSFVAFLVAAGLVSISFILLYGLPREYRRKPGSIPMFYTSLLRRPVPLHFLASTFAQSFWLSAPLISRSWMFLFSSQHLPDHVTLILIASFVTAFICVTQRAAIYSGSHGQWVLPIFSFGASLTIHPRWAQTFWSISRTGLSLPWAQLPYVFRGRLLLSYSPFLSALLGRSLWLHLGMLDLLVGLGSGLALMQALPRQHVLFVSTVGQVLGAVGMMVARATILQHGTEPGAAAAGLEIVRQMFPDISQGLLSESGYASGIFCLVISTHMGIAVGWLWWFRSAQLQKP